MRHGFFGGTFDPVHTGHLLLAETIRSGHGLDKIFFIPAANPPHKPKAGLTPARLRYEMVRLAVDDNPRFSVLDLEMTGTVRYTVDTVRRILENPDLSGEEPHLIIGMDSLAEMDSWKEPEVLLSSVVLLVAGRPGHTLDQVDPKYRSGVQIVNAPLISISSTEIRERVRKGLSIRYWVHPAVERYIHEKGLYLR